MLSVLPSVIVLGFAVIAAIILAGRRTSPPAFVSERLSASHALGFSTAIQSVHFIEEATTGFHQKFPALFGLPSMPLSFFVMFNLIWIAIWVASIPALRRSRPTAFFAAWFLSIAGILNGVGHPLLSIASGRYFPGLVSSPFIGLACLWTWFKLRAATQPRTT